MDKEELEGCAGSCSSCSSCGHDHHEEAVEDGMSPVVTLTDEEGNDVKFEILDVVALDEKEYLVVAEAEGEDSDDVEVTILEIKEDAGEEVYDTVTDETIADKVFKEFQSQQEEM